VTGVATVEVTIVVAVIAPTLRNLSAGAMTHKRAAIPTTNVTPQTRLPVHTGQEHLIHALLRQGHLQMLAPFPFHRQRTRNADNRN